MDWSLVKEWTPLSVVLGLLVWLVVHYLPLLISNFQESLRQQRQDFREELQQQRKEFIHGLRSACHYTPWDGTTERRQHD